MVLDARESLHQFCNRAVRNARRLSRTNL